MEEVPIPEAALSKKKQRMEITKELFKRLYEQFEVVREYKPLELGVHKKLIEMGFVEDRVVLATMMSWHTGRERYMRGIAAGGKRYALDGSEAGDISEEHQEMAKATIKKIVEKKIEANKLKKREEYKRKKQEEKEQQAALKKAQEEAQAQAKAKAAADALAAGIPQRKILSLPKKKKEQA